MSKIDDASLGHLPIYTSFVDDSPVRCTATKVLMLLMDRFDISEK